MGRESGNLNRQAQCEKIGLELINFKKNIKHLSYILVYIEQCDDIKIRIM